MIVVHRENLASIAKQLASAPGVLESFTTQTELGLRVDPAHVFKLIETMKAQHGFVHFIDVTAADYSKYSEPRPGRFSVVYILLSPVLGVKVVVKTYLPAENPAIRSITSLFAGADWPEREAYDMYGIQFDGHPNLKRILLPEGFEGYPLRKEYPLKGRGERASYPIYTAISGHKAPEK